MADIFGKENKIFKLFRDISSQAFGINPNQPEPQSFPPNESDKIDPYRFLQNDLSSTHSGHIDLRDLPSNEMSTPYEGYAQYSRRQRYREYEILEEMTPEIQAALDTYADEGASKGEDGNVIRIECKNKEVQKEISFLFFDLIGINEKAWGYMRNLCKYGDLFLEHVIDPQNPDLGVLKLQDIDCTTMWRIESRRGQLLEFQQTSSSPDYNVVIHDLQTKWLAQSDPHKDIYWKKRLNPDHRESNRVIRFAPCQITHVRIGGRKVGFYPYGVSILSGARRPSHNLKLMEDAMLCYRLTRAPERRVFYIDVGLKQGHQIEEYLNQFKNKIKKKKVYNERTQGVDEEWSPLSVDDDIFIPIRPGVNSRVDPLPGAQNLGEIDDALYFRKKLYVVLKIPPGYLEQSMESQQNRLTLSSIDIRFAKIVERQQIVMEKAFTDIAKIHLALRNVPQSLYEDLQVKMSPSSDWREIAKSEVIEARTNRASMFKQLEMFDDMHILSKILKIPEDEAEEIIRNREIYEIRKAQVQGQIAEVGARSQANIERASAINQARTQSEIEDLKDSEEEKESDNENIGGLSSSESESEEGEETSPNASGEFPDEEDYEKEIVALDKDEDSSSEEKESMPRSNNLDAVDFESEWEDWNL